jgi:hypothetical protein
MGFRPEDIEPLRLWWALSEKVGMLAERVRARPREIAGVIEAEETVAEGVISGILDACETARIQARTGNPGLFAVAEPSTTWLSGPNRLLSMTLMEAERVIQATLKGRSGSLLHEPIANRYHLLEEALRISAIREILSSPAGRTRLTPHERRQAAKARTALYRLANQAAEMLRGVEALDENVLEQLLSESILPCLEPWQRFELATLIACTEALGEVCDTTPVLDTAFSSIRPAARVGPFSVWWQRIVRPRPWEALDQGEAMAATLASSLGVAAGAGRADLTIEVDGRVVGFVECKWFGVASSARGAILEACTQIVGYARDEAYRTDGDAEAILSRSLIALAARHGTPIADGSTGVACADIEDMEAHRLGGWAERIIRAI